MSASPSRRRWIRVVAAIAAAGFILYLLFRPEPPLAVIDGREVGQRECLGVEYQFGEPMCGQFTAFARTQLDTDQPGHPAIRDVEIYEDPAFFKNGGVYGYFVVVVARLDDGTAAVYRMNCNVVSPEDGCPPELTQGP